MLTPFDDYPIHQTALPVAHPGSGDPNHYDRYFFNGYREDLYLGVAMGHYPNRGVIDAAVSVVHDGVQRSVFASGRMPADPAHTAVGPITLEVVEPLRTTSVSVDDAGLGISGEITFEARTVAVEEPRQTSYRGSQLMLDSTRLTQWGTWSGSLDTAAGRIDLDATTTYGTKDRSWGVRPVGQPAPSAPPTELPQIFFLWNPVNFPDRCTHFLCFEHADGRRWVESAAEIDVLGPDDPTWGDDGAIRHLAGGGHAITWQPGLRQSMSATVTLHHPDRLEVLSLEPLVTFRMRGIGYLHPEWAHGTWKGELETGSEEHAVEDLADLAPANIHIQQVVRATSDRGDEGLGVLEQLAFGAHEPSGLTGFLDGYAPPDQ